MINIEKKWKLVKQYYVYQLRRKHDNILSSIINFLSSLSHYDFLSLSLSLSSRSACLSACLHFLISVTIPHFAHCISMNHISFLLVFSFLFFSLLSSSLLLPSFHIMENFYFLWSCPFALSNITSNNKISYRVGSRNTISCGRLVYHIMSYYIVNLKMMNNFHYFLLFLIS